jgi:hypothetical protein
MGRVLSSCCLAVHVDIPGGRKTFVIFSERDGWRRACVVTRDGSSVTPITAAGSDLIAPGQIDDKNDSRFFRA